jgi:hypothetical protein
VRSEKAVKPSRSAKSGRVGIGAESRGELGRQVRPEELVELADLARCAAQELGLLRAQALLFPDLVETGRRIDQPVERAAVPAVDPVDRLL